MAHSSRKPYLLACFLMPIILSSCNECAGNGDCGPDEYRNRFAGRCGSSEVGLCEPRPLTCPEIDAPVCGCDGNTYSNSCEAASNGVTLAFHDECCRTQCEVPTFFCEEQPLDSFSNFGETASAWMHEWKDEEPFDIDDDGIVDVPSIYAGACDNGINFLLLQHAFGGRLHFFDAESGEFIGMVNQTDINIGECWGSSFWPERIGCPRPVVTHVFIGENYMAGDSIVLFEAP